MKFNFAKSLLVSSAFALGAFGLVACDSGSDGPTEAETPKDADLIITGLDVFPLGEIVMFNGFIEVDNANASIDQEANFAIDSLKFEVADSQMKKTKVTPTTKLGGATYNAGANADKISLEDTGIQVNLKDPNFTTCGEFILNFIVYAHLDKQKKTTSGQIKFNRDASFCPEPVASSSSGGAVSTEIEMTSYTVQMSTDTKPGLNLATGEASASATADIVLSKVSGGVIIGSGNGTLFAPIANETMTPNNYDDDYDATYWPEEANSRSAYLSDFKFKNVTKTQITDAVEAGSAGQLIYIAKTVNADEKTGVGIYAFAVTEAKEVLNGDFNVTLKVYKKK